MTPEQAKEAQRWSYLLKGISWQHQQDWRATILREQGREAAELFDRRVRYVNRSEL